MDFGPSYCINLPERTDRWERVMKEFAKIKLQSIERFNAVKAVPGWGGCRESHLAIFELCRGFKRYTIFEDDIMFLGDPLSVLAAAEKQLPPDWDALWLGANLMAPVRRYSKNLYHLTNGYCTHGIIYNNVGIADFVLNHRAGMRKIDVFLQTMVQEQFKCFITYPMVATQADSFSDVTNKRTFYSAELIRKFNKMILP